MVLRFTYRTNLWPMMRRPIETILIGLLIPFMDSCARAVKEVPPLCGTWETLPKRSVRRWVERRDGFPWLARSVVLLPDQFACVYTVSPDLTIVVLEDESSSGFNRRMYNEIVAIDSGVSTHIGFPMSDNYRVVQIDGTTYVFLTYWYRGSRDVVLEYGDGQFRLLTDQPADEGMGADTTGIH